MVWCHVLAIAGLAAWVSGCAQGRDAPRAHLAPAEPRPGPVITRGPDDGVPFASPRTHAPVPTAPPPAVPAHDVPQPQGGALSTR